MRGRTYSLDFRNKVIEFLKRGNTQKLASEIFNISKMTVNAWNARYRKEGTCAAKKIPGAKPKINTEEFIEYVEANPNMRSRDIGKKFNMTDGGALYWLKKLGFRYKKKPLPTWKPTKKSEKNIALL